ncbi:MULTISPECIES: hypothetical protein [unclassified Nocardia]|uniref:hypothetical protein n=1 Tax=unclassified Nocardia TaxID=2637762 RepID=UPI001CE44E4A|nr:MULTISPECIES: hypothetical protein [unclassified Nocardia]
MGIAQDHEIAESQALPPESGGKADATARCHADAAPDGDPAEILLSSQVPYTGDPADTAANVAAFGAAGTELAIVYLTPPHTPTMLEPLANALSTLLSPVAPQTSTQPSMLTADAT